MQQIIGPCLEEKSWSGDVLVKSPGFFTILPCPAELAADRQGGEVTAMKIAQVAHVYSSVHVMKHA